MGDVNYNNVEELDKEIEAKIIKCLKEKTKDKFKGKLKDELSELLIKYLDAKGYIDNNDKERIKNQVIILFENSTNQSETNNSIVEYMSIADKLDDNDLEKLRYTRKDIESFMGTISKIDEIVGHVNNIIKIYDSWNGTVDSDEKLTETTMLVMDEIGSILGCVPYVGAFLEFEMDLLKRLFEVESNLIESHLEQIDEANKALEEILNPQNDISDEKRSEQINNFMNSDVYKAVDKMPSEICSECEFSEDLKNIVDIIKEENPELWEEFKNSDEYKDYEENTNKASDAKENFDNNTSKAEDCLNNGGSLGNNPSENSTKWWEFWKWEFWWNKNDTELSTGNDNAGNAGESKSPLILDLNGDGIKTSSIENGTYFDFDSNGFSEKTAWVDADDGILVRDINQNGQIDDLKALVKG